ncbi:hypothetical protein EDC04DRAFT_2720283, partial [Pisolithus marmoratus]
IQRTIGDRSVVPDTLKEITRASYKVFFDTIEAQGRAILHIPLSVFSTVQSHFCILAERISCCSHNLHALWCPICSPTPGNPWSPLICACHGKP